MIKMTEIELSLKKEFQTQYKRLYTESYKILRHNRQIKFLDYNIIEIEKKYHIKLNPCLLKLGFIILPEYYNMKRVHTTNLSISIGDKIIDPMESNNKLISNLNFFRRINKTNEFYENVGVLLRNLLDENQNSKKKQRIELCIDKLKEYFKTLKSYYFYHYKEFLKTSNIVNKSNYNKTLLNQKEKELLESLVPLKEIWSMKDRKLRGRIVYIIHNVERLINIKTEHLIAIELPSNLELEREFHISVTLKTEELHEGCAIDRKFPKLRNYIIGEIAEFNLPITSREGASDYYEIIPPLKTRISRVYLIDEELHCTIMAIDEEKSNNEGRIYFEEDFDEKFIAHIPREKTGKIENKFIIRFEPYVMVQRWVVISLILGILNILLILCYWFGIINWDYTSFVNVLRYQGPLTYGLIIGNNLWLQEPKFLWKKTTYTSIFIIVAGITVNTIFLFNFIF